MRLTEGTEHFLDQAEFAWSNPDALEFYEIMIRAYGGGMSAQMILARAEVDSGGINSGQSPRDLWKQALDVAASSGRLRPLADLALVDKQITAYHPRLGRLLGASPAPEEPTNVEPVVWGGNELITGKQATFLEMSFLRDGLRMAASVVRLGTVVRGGKEFQATGFLIAPDLILTNHHVLHDVGGCPVEQVTIWFNYELDAVGRPREVDPYEGDVATIVGDARHDWAIVRPRTPFKSAYPVFKLRSAKPVARGDFVFIVQHPGGRPKKIGLLHNEVVNVTLDRVQYLTDTLPGSSGSPVCNEFWEVVALHHSGLAVDAACGTPCKNQGIHVNRVIEGLAAHGIILNQNEKEG